MKLISQHIIVKNHKQFDLCLKSKFDEFEVNRIESAMSEVSTTLSLQTVEDKDIFNITGLNI